MAIKMRVLHTGKGKLAALAPMIHQEFGLDINATDVIPPAYSCNNERLVVLMIATKGDMENKVRLFCRELTKARAQNVALVIDGTEAGAKAVKDVLAEAGTKVCAAADGTVYTVYNDESMGMTVVISHDGGYTTRYSSLAETVSVVAGEKVTAGQTIGTVANTALMETAIANMKQDGAEVIVVYMHWGNEYRLTTTQTQRTMAQKLCDLGVDVIVGAHPHVVEPVDLLTSTVSGKNTLCVYSMGNAISNQRVEEPSITMKSGHTEDGMLFSFTVTKYSDGSVRLTDAAVLPTWVHLYSKTYQIIPLDKTVSDWSVSFLWRTENLAVKINMWN